MQILRSSQVEDIIGLSRVTIWRMENEGKFPKRRQLGANSVGWIESEVQEWIAERPQVGLVNDIAIPALDKEAKSQERAKI